MAPKCNRAQTDAVFQWLMWLYVKLFMNHGVYCVFSSNELKVWDSRPVLLQNYDWESAVSVQNIFNMMPYVKKSNKTCLAFLFYEFWNKLNNNIEWVSLFLFHVVLILEVSNVLWVKTTILDWETLSSRL